MDQEGVDHLAVYRLVVYNLCKMLFYKSGYEMKYVFILFTLFISCSRVQYNPEKDASPTGDVEWNPSCGYAWIDLAALNSICGSVMVGKKGCDVRKSDGSLTDQCIKSSKIAERKCLDSLGVPKDMSMDIFICGLETEKIKVQGGKAIFNDDFFKEWEKSQPKKESVKATEVRPMPRNINRNK